MRSEPPQEMELIQKQVEEWVLFLLESSIVSLILVRSLSSIYVDSYYESD